MLNNVTLPSNILDVSRLTLLTFHGDSRPALQSTKFITRVLVISLCTPNILNFCRYGTDDILVWNLHVNRRCDRVYWHRAQCVLLHSPRLVRLLVCRNFPYVLVVTCVHPLCAPWICVSVLVFPIVRCWKFLHEIWTLVLYCWTLLFSGGIFCWSQWLRTVNISRRMLFLFALLW